jgi:hypothetical protein
MSRRLPVLLLALCLLAASPAPAPAPAQAAAPPAFRYDVAWMKLPPQWRLGDVSAVAVDKADNVWVLHRPRSLTGDQRELAAPPVLEFDRNGKFIRGWGGPGEGYDWPFNEHSLFVDRHDRVWLTGSSRTGDARDNAVLVFTAAGKFIRQIGKPNASQGDQDTDNLGAPADLYVDDARRELYVADGYANRRVIVFDSETGAFKRMWGAFGAPPPTTPLGPAPPVTRPQGAPEQTGDGATEFRSVHGVELSRDGLVYVSDRDSQRVQVFDRAGRYKAQVFIHRNAVSRQTASGLGLSPDRGQRWLYVLDFGNGQMEILDRKTLTRVGDIGGEKPGRAAGEFTGPHLMAVDSKGVIYVAEVQGRRVQRLVPRP